MIVRRRIILRLGFCEDIGDVNHAHFNNIGIKENFKTDETYIKLHHKEFPVVPECSECREYTVRHARIKFPYLFKDTNPLLYRVFDSNDSWYMKDRYDRGIKLSNYKIRVY